jgi:hypothetical protein
MIERPRFDAVDQLLRLAIGWKKNQRRDPIWSGSNPRTRRARMLIPRKSYSSQPSNPNSRRADWTASSEKAGMVESEK